MIIDTNILIYSKHVEYEFLSDLIFDRDKVTHVSSISLLETLGYYKISDDEKNYFEVCFKQLEVLDIDKKIVQRATKLRQQKKMSVADAIIAATALEYDMRLCTRNTKDFKGIKNLKLENPFDK